MKILWFTGVSSKHNNSYGGGGWIRSLASELSKRDDIQLATAYFYDDDISAFTSITSLSMSSQKEIVDIPKDNIENNIII